VAAFPRPCTDPSWVAELPGGFPMSRRHADPVEVLRRDGVPAQFIWAGRLYKVVDVLARWTEAGAWWEGVVEGSGRPAAAAPPAPRRGQRAWGEPAPESGAVAVLDASPDTASGIDDREREYWRVEAGRGLFAGTGVFDLCRDTAAEAWWLVRVAD
jgi:hypothetical protein